MAPKAKTAPDAKAKAASAKAEARVTRSAAKAATKPEPAKAEPKAAPTEADDKKRKAEEEAKNAAPKKEAKTEEPKPKTDKDDGEKEKDAPADKRTQLSDPVAFSPSDTTLNIVPTQNNKVVMSLSEGGMQYMIAGARANTGVKAGRYMYEVKIIEALNPAESAGAQRGKVPMPRQLVRVGFSTAEAHLILGQDDEAVFFDAEGNYNTGKTKKLVSQRFTRDQVIGVVLNLDPQSPNHNTISLFKEGDRICEPQPLPEHLHGKPLFPHVSFRSVTVQMGFGPTPLKALPFNCRLLSTAAQADVTVRKEKLNKDGKCEVLVPVAFPDEGTFAWLDGFLEKNPHFVEISDRKILEWAKASGCTKTSLAGSTSFKASHDKPEFNFGLPGMDDQSIRKVLYNLLPHIPRNYVIMEVKANLLKESRAELLSRFSAPHFKTVATVVMGNPSDEYKEKKLSKALEEKQEKANAEWKAKKAEEERKKQVALRQKQLVDMRKKAEEQRKKVLEEAKKKREAEAAKKEKEKKKKEKEAAKKKKEAEKAKKAAERQKKIDAGEEVPEEEEEEPEEPSEEEPEEEEVKKEDEEMKEEPKEEETKDEEMKEEEKDEPPPTVELTEEEKAQVFKTGAVGAVPDLTAEVLNQSYGKFSVPDNTEAFDELRFEWDGQAESSDYLRKWVLDRKANSRVEDLQPSEWFKEKHHEWLKLFAGWQTSAKKYNISPAKKAKEAAKKKKEEAAKKAEADGTAVDEEEDVEMEVDIFAVENLDDIRDGEPLYANFAHEDWALLQLRMEMYFLYLAFKKDVNDEDRPGIPEAHIVYYYTKYFRKTLNIKHFNVASNKELCELVKDTVKIDEEQKNILASTLAEETESFDIFVKLTEECRRERQRRIDAGDETAKIKFSPLAVQQPSAARVGASAKPTGVVPTPVNAKPAGIRPTTGPITTPRPAYGRLTGVRPVGPR